MSSASPTDPRRDPRAEDDIRPQVATPAAGVATWLIVLGFVLLGAVLFVVLDGRRRAAYAPQVRPMIDDASAPLSQPAPLFIPPAPQPLPTPSPTPTPTPSPVPRIPVFTPPPQPRIVYVQQPAPPAPPPQPQARVSNEPVLVIDTGTGAAPPVTSPGGRTSPDAAGQTDAYAARATMVRHPQTIVAQGTLIPAVLESALDSTRAGPVRAVVSRDVRGFDGSMILVPRGSRLFGDYSANLQPGQNRALVMWTRLVRPDGATIALASPAADPLGRAGIRGSVNSHFFERFATAILQSSLDIGVNYASRLGTNNSAVVVALPGAAQTIGQPLIQGRQIQPTLRVRQGTAIDVFVARDLDFTAVEARK